MTSVGPGAPSPGVRAGFVESYRRGIEAAAQRSPSVKVGMSNEQVIRATIGDFVADMALEKLRAHFDRQQAAWTDGNFLVEGNPYPLEGGTARVDIMSPGDWKDAAPLYGEVKSTEEGRCGLLAIITERLSGEGLEVVRLETQPDRDLVDGYHSYYDQGALMVVIRDREFLKEFQPAVYAKVLEQDAAKDRQAAEEFLGFVKHLPRTFFKRRLKLDDESMNKLVAGYPKSPSVRKLVEAALNKDLEAAEGGPVRVQQLRQRLEGA